MQLTDDERQRYARQIGPGVLTEDQQAKLKASTVLVTRVGGMGGPASQMLTMAGVGRVIIAHGGELIEPDLNRQVLGCEAGLGKTRAETFGDYLRSLNRFVEVESLAFEPNDLQALELAERCDLLVSCAPTFAERLRLGSASVHCNVPLIDAAQWGVTGTMYVSHPDRDPCLSCLYPQEPSFEEFFPVVGAISCMMGAMAALEGVKILSGMGRPLWGTLSTYDGMSGRSTQIKVTAPASACPVCGRSKQRTGCEQREGL